MTRQTKTSAYYWLNGKRRYLAKMWHCRHGEQHEHIEGVLYRRCLKCGNIYAVRDNEYIKRKGEVPVDNCDDVE